VAVAKSWLSGTSCVYNAVSLLTLRGKPVVTSDVFTGSYSKPTCNVAQWSVSHTHTHTLFVSAGLSCHASLGPESSPEERDRRTATRPALWQPICLSLETKIDEARPG